MHDLHVTGLDHVVLNVADVERSLAFYCDELGLEPVRVEEWRRGEAPFPSVRVDAGTILDLLAAPRTGVNADHLCLVVEPVDLTALGGVGGSWCSTARRPGSGPAATARRSTSRTRTGTPSSCATTAPDPLPARYGAHMDVGDVVEDFELPDETGTPRTLSGLLANGPVVLFFYPAAMTTGCTKESCHFRDLSAEFAAVGAQRVGISRDTVDKQHQFSEKHDFDYPLLSDSEGTVARAMGVARKKGPPKRVTFVIDQNRRVVEVVKSEIRMGVHADRALDALEQLQH